MNKILRVVATVLLVVIGLAVLAVGGFFAYDRITYWDFYSNAEKAFAIPGLWDGVVQQGFDYSEELGIYLYSGYMKDHSASRIYIIGEDGESRYVTLKEEDGTDHTGHVGGVSFGGDYVYVTASSDDQILLFSLADVLDEDGTATACGRFDVCVSPAYVYVRGNQLYTGEFYRAVDYETPEEHRLTTPAGDENTAIVGVYTLGADGMPVSASPDYVMSTTAQVQGMAFDAEGRLLLSTSWGLSKSYIYVYDLTNAATGTVTLDGEELTVKYVDSTCLKDTIVAPPMAEELVVRDGKLLIMNESASMKYIFGKLTSGNHVWAFDYSVVE